MTVIRNANSKRNDWTGFLNSMEMFFPNKSLSASGKSLNHLCNANKITIGFIADHFI